MPAKIAVLQGWIQIAIGMAGFIGVIATLFVNAWLSRRAHEREIGHQRTILRRAIAEELRRCLGLLRNLGVQLSSLQAGSILIPPLPPRTVYDALVPSLGLLSPDEIAAVIRAYDAVSVFNAKVGLFGTFEEKTPSLSYVRIEGGRASYLAQVCRNHADPIEEGIRALGGRLDPPAYIADQIEVPGLPPLHRPVG